jgi:FkbM family methyltransferase
MNTFLSAMTDSPAVAAKARSFWRAFTSDTSRPKFVFGCNVYSESISQHAAVDGFIDDFSKKPSFCDRPIVKSADIPKNALVLAASGGRPLTVRRMLDKLGVEQLDYFAVRKWADTDLKDVVFNEGYTEEFKANEAKFQWIHDRLADDVSRDIFRRLVSFRLTYDLDVLEGFTDRQKEQYFEPFLKLKPDGETFLDVGCFDGFTSLEFMKHCPNYRAIHAFEPDPANLANCERNLAGRPNLTLWPLGASDHKGTVSFSMAGSASGVTSAGEMAIAIDKIDDVLKGKGAPTFIKMDTEGSEAPALTGAAATIKSHTPRLAISVYHKPADFWRIPRLVLDMSDNYEIYMRHYTECIYETVMSFVPHRIAGG